ncbi:OmpA family protein [Paracoccus sp. PAR01]|uniref:OmpA family protein n=1 Tax=Paracoccus sp. PAR01 TaxID=2769282 RepID=UPI00351C1FF5
MQDDAPRKPKHEAEPESRQKQADEDQPKPRQNREDRAADPEPRRNADDRDGDRDRREDGEQRPRREANDDNPDRRATPAIPAVPASENPEGGARPATPAEPARDAQRDRAQDEPQREGEKRKDHDKRPANIEELRRAMEADKQKDDQPRRDRPRVDDDQRDRRPEPEQARRDDDGKPREKLTSDELKRRLDRGDGEARVQAPEARHRDNDVTRRAAEKKAPTAAAALVGDGKGEVSERRVTRDNARRSDQDFRTRIQDGDNRDSDDLRRNLERRERELREDETRADRRERALDRRDDQLDRRDDQWDRERDRNRDRDEARDNDDDDNDTLKTVGALLLAGAAGMAVGKMLDGRQVALNTGDRVVMTMPDGSQQIVRDDNALLYQPGSNVQTETFQDGSTRTTVLREDGSRVVTIRDANANILRRTLIRRDGTQVPLINDTAAQPVRVSTLPKPKPVEYYDRPLQEDELRTALLQESAADRRFTLGQIRDIPEVRALVAPVNVPQITYDTGSAALASSQAEQLSTLGKVITDAIAQNPNEMFMIEGYTDAVGSKASNLALSDRRAESLALALTEYFQVPPENMVVQGYGEDFLLVPSDGPQRENRRVGVRRITDLLEQSGS